MRAPADLRPLVAALCAGVVLGACGDGLYDASGVPLLEGSGLTCEAGLVVCGEVCTPEDAGHCGSACADCTAAAPPEGAVAACLREGPSASCGYACTGGLLKCSAGCCATQALAAGDAHTCARLAGGEVACWGANASGQVGDGTNAQRLSPRRVALGAAAVAIAAGVSHTCAVTSAGAVLCWGANEAGQVTGSPSAPILAPAAVAGVSGAIAVAAGRAHTCALSTGGGVRCWGANDVGQLGPGGQPITSGATAIAAGRDHACALVGDQVRCWGSNASGQLGATPTGDIAVPIASGIQRLAAGGDQTCAATGTSGVVAPVDDALRCWGQSLDTRWLFTVPQPTPQIPRRQVDRATIEFDVVLLATGTDHLCVRNQDGAIECLGANDRGQLGGGLLEDGRTITVTLPGTTAMAPATALSAGGAHTCAADAVGQLRCWGANDAGQLGDGTTVSPGVGVLATPLGR